MTCFNQPIQFRSQGCIKCCTIATVCTTTSPFLRGENFPVVFGVRKQCAFSPGEGGAVRRIGSQLSKQAGSGAGLVRRWPEAVTTVEPTHADNKTSVRDDRILRGFSDS